MWDPAVHAARVPKRRGLDEEIARFKGEEEGVMTGEILTPCWETITGNEERFFQLTVEFCGELGVDELRNQVWFAETFDDLRVLEDFVPTYTE